MPGGTPRFRLFISSTFLDFDAEREALRAHVYPRLRDRCAARDAVFEAVDLRWGISRGAADARRTLELCLAEVDRCVAATERPNFLLLVGDRLGWRPLPGRVEEPLFERLSAALAGSDGARLLRRWYPHLDTNTVPACRHVEEPADAAPGEERRLVREVASVSGDLDLSASREALLAGSGTEQECRRRLEIAPVTDDRMLVVARSLGQAAPAGTGRPWSDVDDHGGPDAEAGRRLAVLRRDVFEALGPAALTVTARLVGDTVDGGYLAAFCSTVHDRLAAAIDAELSARERRPVAEREADQHRRFAEERARLFVGRGWELRRIAGWLAGPGGRPLVVHGPSGAGKTSLLAAASLSEAFPARAVVRFVGATGSASECTGLVAGLLRGLRPDLPVPTVPEDAADELARVLATWPVTEPVTVVVDALDQLEDDYERALGVPVPSSVHLLLSVLDGPPRERLSTVLPDLELLPVPPLARDDAALALDRWLRSAARALSAVQRESLLTAFASSGRPLHLRLLFEQARGWRSSTPPPPLPTGTLAALDGLITALSAEHGEALVRATMTLLAASREGLSAAELADLLSTDAEVMAGARAMYPDSPPFDVLPPVVWSRLQQDLSPYLAERERRGAVTLDFFHRQVADVVERRWPASGQAGTRGHRRLASYFGSQPDWVGSPASPNRRKLIELPFHLTEGHDADRLKALLGEPDTLRAMLAARGPWETTLDLDRAASVGPGTDLPALRDALRAAGPVLAADPAQLPSQLLGRLPTEQRALRDRIRSLSWPRPWLEPLTPSLAVGALRFVLTGHHGTTRSLAVSGDGRWCATVGNSEPDRTVRVWSLATGRNTRVFPGAVEGGSWTPVGFDHRGHVILGTGVTVISLDPRTGRRHGVLRGGSPISCLATASRSALLVAGCAEDVMVLPHPGARVARTRVDGQVRALAVSPNGAHVAVLSDAGVTLLGPDGRVEASLSRELEPAGTSDPPWGSEPLAVSDHGGTVRFGGRLREWDVSNGTVRDLLAGTSWPLPRRVLTLTPDGERALVSPGLDEMRDQHFPDGESRLLAGWDVGSPEPGPAMPDPGSAVAATAITPDGRLGVAGHADHVVRVWDLGKQERPVAHDNPIAGITVQGRRALVVDRGRVTSRWDLGNGARRDADPADPLDAPHLDAPHLDAPDRFPRRVRPGGGGSPFRRRGARSLVVGPQGEARWVPVLRGRVGVLYVPWNGKFSESPDPPDVADVPTAPFDIWRLTRRGVPLRRRHHGAGECGPLLDVRVTEDGAAAVASTWGSLRVYDLRTARQRRRLVGHQGPVWSLAVVEGAGLVVSGSEDATVRVWTLSTGKQVAAFTGESPIRAVGAASTSAGVRVVAGEDSGRVHVLRLRT